MSNQCEWCAQCNHICPDCLAREISEIYIDPQINILKKQIEKITSILTNLTAWSSEMTEHFNYTPEGPGFTEAQAEFISLAKQQGANTMDDTEWVVKPSEGLDSLHSTLDAPQNLPNEVMAVEPTGELDITEPIVTGLVMLQLEDGVDHIGELQASHSL